MRGPLVVWTAAAAAAVTDPASTAAGELRQLAAHAGVHSVGGRVFDGTNQTDAAALSRVIPNIFRETLSLAVVEDDVPLYWSVAFVKGAPAAAADAVEEGSGGIISDALKELVSSEAATTHQPTEDHVNALLTYPAPILAANRTTHIRFVEIPEIDETFTTESYSFGLTREAAFGADYNITGLFLGSQGNLQLNASPTSSNVGSAAHAVRASFAEPSTQGKIVDFYVESKPGGQTDVYMAVGGRSFGHAFDIPRTSANQLDPLDLLPAVQFHPDQTMAVAVVVWRPTPLAAHAPYHTKQRATGPGLTGDWVIPEDRNTAPETKPTVVVKIVEGPSELSSLTHEIQVTTRVVNIIKVSYKVGLLGQITSRSPIMSTRMGGPPELMAVEQNILQLLECAEVITINDHKQLLVKCADDTTKQVFDAYVDTADRAVTINPWLIKAE